MKVYKIDAFFYENTVWHGEYFFEFKDGESDKYFAEAGEWEHAFWFTKGEGDTFSTDDLDSWVDRIPSCELTDADCNRLTEQMLSGRFSLNANLTQGESATYYKSHRYYVKISCLYDGEVEGCPEFLQFDLARSEKEV